MTLLDMIKKYEKMKTEMEEVHDKPHPPGGRWSTQMKIVDGVLEDLRSVEAHSSK